MQRVLVGPNLIGIARSAVLVLAAFALLRPPALLAQQAPAAKAEYSGSEPCGVCHAEQFEQFKKTYMYTVLSTKYPPEQQGCEACHGPGAAHVSAESDANDAAARQKAGTLIYSFRRHAASENAERCLACHRKNENERLFWRSLHQAAGVFCADCHTAHLTATANPDLKPSRPIGALFSVPNRDAERNWLDNHLLRLNQPQLCFGCHKDIEAQFQLPVHHRVNEGTVKCTDCHNPHGSVSEKQLRDGATESCTGCHAEKKGPFVFEHAAIRGEGCTACHTPHGSVNTNLLKRRQQRQLCLECHAPPEAIGIPHPRLGDQEAGDCTRCHVDIHGSNYQEEFLR
jgi:predicted CXXCH cytochrome family protein